MFSSTKAAFLFLPWLVLGQNLSKYKPDDLSLSHGGLDNIPGLFDLSASLTESQNVTTDSFWTSSYITSYDGGNYLVITHMINDPSGKIITRSAFLDLETHTYSQMQNITDNATFYDQTTGLADLKGPGFTMYAISDTDPLAGLHVESNVPDVHINLTFNTQSPALVNGGTGAFILSNAYSFEWAIPRARTWGTLTVNETKIEVDPENSFTWFDRQFNSPVTPTITTKSSASAASWHWFQLHISPSNSSDTLSVPVSAWVVDYGNGVKAQFASIRQSPGVQAVIPVNSLDTAGRTWTSPYTNITYEQQFGLEFADGSTFKLEVITENQEMNSDNGASPAYEGYLTFTGTYQGNPVTGYGIVEIVKNFG